MAVIGKRDCRRTATCPPEPQEELGISHQCPGWLHCALCRSTRLGAETLRRARERRVEWRDPNTPLTNPVREPTPYTSLDDAFDAMMQFMSTTSRKCGNFHCCHAPHSPGTQSHKHYVRYHTASSTHTCGGSTPSPPPQVTVNALPGNYTITAARWGSNTPTSRHVTLDPKKSITMTMTV